MVSSRILAPVTGQGLLPLPAVTPDFDNAQILSFDGESKMKDLQPGLYRLRAKGAGCYWSIGSAPSAAANVATSLPLDDGETDYIYIPVAMKIAAIQQTAAGILYIVPAKTEA